MNKVFEKVAPEAPKNDFGVPDSLYENAMEQMKDMDPEKLKEIQEKVKNMSPDERDNLMKMAQGFMKK